MFSIGAAHMRHRPLGDLHEVENALDPVYRVHGVGICG